MSETQLDPRDTFAGMGRTYQEKVMQAMLEDGLFADTMIDVLNPQFFDVSYLQECAQKFFDHKRKYKTFPSPDVLEIMVTKADDADNTVSIQVRDYMKRIREHPLNGDS